MKLKTLSLIVVSFILTTVVLAGSSDKLFRFPAISPDGKTVSFSYQGDIWTVPSSGGEAVRRTVHEAYEGISLWSPNGKEIAFVSSRFGNNDIFIMPAEGGIPARITYHSAGDELTDWSADGYLLFTTARNFKQVEWDNEIYTANSEGGTPFRLLDAVGHMPVKSPDGRFIAFVRGACRITREAYRGPANKNLWLYDTKEDKYIQLTTDEGQDIYPKWTDNNEIYFLSARSGVYNIHKLAIDTKGNIAGEIKQVTDFKEDGIRYFDLKPNSPVAVFERMTDIFSLDLTTEKTEKVKISLGADYKFDPVEHKIFTSKADNFSVSPNDKYIALVIHGEVFVKRNNKKKSKAVNLSDSPYRDMTVDWLNDSTIIFASDRDGQFDLYSVQSADPKETDIFKSLKHKITRLTETEADEKWPVVSPDGKKVAFDRGRGQLVVAEINDDGTLGSETILLDGWDSPGGVAWSPDSKWLAYSLDDLDFNSEIFIHAADGSKDPVNVSMHPRGDRNPVWSPAGDKLGFISERNNNDNDVWFVWLNKKDWEKSKEDWEESDEEENGKKDKKDKEKTEKVKDVIIDFDNIYERIVQVTSLPGDEGNLAISKDGKTFFFSAVNPPNKGKDLFSVEWDGSEMKALTKGGVNPYSVKLDGKGKKLFYFKSGGKLAGMDIKSGKSVPQPYSAKMDINYNAELEQIFEEAWRTLRDGFYDPEFHGRDWDALKAKYKPWCLASSTKNDFRDMYNIMLGQLDASHMGMYGSGREETQKESTGRLGVELMPVSEGMKVIRVIPNTPADKEESKLYVGDVITSVNGKPVNEKINFYSLLTNSAKEKTLMTVLGTGNEEREVVIRPVNSVRSQLYDEWVKERRKLTEEYSGGKLGYLHIRAMGWSSFERFERELTAAGYGKEGIVIDVRFNGGGWTTDYLMTVLNVKQHAYTIPRGAAGSLKDHSKFKNHYPFGERLPYAAWTKPSIAMCNQNSYSNAEIFSHAYKTLRIGKLVGEPTFGAVISTGGQGLIDGSFVRLPFRAWFVKATEKNMEHGPAVPDIIVSNNPDDKTKGKDTQLKRAVKELLKEIK